MISKTRLVRRARKKTHDEVVKTIREAMKNKQWNKIAKIVSGSKRKYSSLNIGEIENQTSEGDTVVVPGKVLGSGNISKRVRICALRFSDGAKEKLKRNKSEMVSLLDEIKKNPRMDGVKILR
jgi:large subunit ribosomal protein L18e